MNNLNLKKIVDWLWQSINWLWVLFTPAADYATCIFMLIVVGLMTSVWKAHVKNTPCDFKTLVKVFIRKFGGYFFALSICVMTDRTLTHSWVAEHIKLLSVIAIPIMFVEIQENIENISAIVGIDLWVLVKDRLNAALNLNKKENTKTKDDEDKGDDEESK